jgi:hypothetical protein
MISVELLDRLRGLSRNEKLQVVQLLVNDLAQEAGVSLEAGTLYEVWSPYDAPEAAATLLEMLEEERRDE